MNIALSHFRVGETDGVSLEMEKWKIALEKMGHKVYYLAGSTGNTKAYIIPELHYKNQLNLKFIENSFTSLDDYTDSELSNAFIEYKEKIKKRLKRFIKLYEIDVLVPNNILSRGWNIPAAMAFTEVIEETGIKCIAHNHDFYWERDKFEKGTCRYVDECLDKCFPPKNDAQIKHVVINEIAKKELKKRKNIKSVNVPNVFNYAAPLWTIDRYNADFRDNIGLNDDDILVLQATRIVERKAIELAIDVVAEIDTPWNRKILYNNPLFDGREFTENNRIVLVLAGLHEFSSKYIEFLKERAAFKGVELLFINNIIEDVRCKKDDLKCYSLWDAFVNSDLVTYPSIYEGWGNQFLETVFAKKPVVMYEYPVYLTDIKKYEFDIISLGSKYTVGLRNLVDVDKKIIDNAAKQSIDLLINLEKRNDMVDKNFEIAKQNFSYESLERYLSKLFK